MRTYLVTTQDRASDSEYPVAGFVVQAGTLPMLASAIRLHLAHQGRFATDAYERVRCVEIAALPTNPKGASVWKEQAPPFELDVHNERPVLLVPSGEVVRL